MSTASSTGSPGKLPSKYKQVGSHNARLTLQVPSDSILIDMVRFGMLAVQLMPEDTSAGMIFFTDGVLGVPDVPLLDSLLTQLRIWTISCTFVLVDSKGSKPDCAFSNVSSIEFMRFLAAATFGAYLEQCPDMLIDNDYEINMYHKTIFCWNFQRAIETSNFNSSSCTTENCVFHFSPIRYKHYSSVLSTTLTAVLSVRLREGYTVKCCHLGDNFLRVHLVLAWKNQVSMEYVIVSDWPPPSRTNSKVQIELWTEGPFDFLNDVLSAQRNFSSPFRAGVVASFFDCVQCLTQADKMLIIFESFRTDPIYYTLPDSVKNGMPIFYLLPDSDVPVISSKELQQKYAKLCNFWRPICTLDMNVWQKWLHTHRITLLLTHDVPLSAHLHTPSLNSGRYGSVTCRQASAAVDKALKDWATFSLLDSHSYVKFEYMDGESIPAFFYIIRPSFKPPCFVVRLAFLGGIDGCTRLKIVSNLTDHLLSVQIKQKLERACKISRVGFPVAQRISRQSSSGRIEEVVKSAACIQSKKPLEKFLVRYDATPKVLQLMIQDDQLNKPTAVNNILCRYMYCKRWVWSLKHPVHGLYVSSDAAGFILNTLLRVRLNQKFHFGCGFDGIITVVKLYPMIKGSICSSSSCIVQFVLHPPVCTVFPSSGNYRTVSRSKNRALHRESICSENEQSELDSTEGNKDIHLITELWVEPQYGSIRIDGDEGKCGDLFTKIFEYDQIVIKTLVTFEHLKLLKDDNALKFYAKRMSIHSRAENESCKSGSLLRRKSFGEIMHDPDVEPCVIGIPCCFDLCLLLKNCQMGVLLFSSLACSIDKSDEDLPNNLFMEAMHHELKRTHDASWILYKDDELRLFWSFVLQRRWHSVKRSSTRDFADCELMSVLNSRVASNNSPQVHRLPMIVCYIKKISHQRLLLVLCPKTLDDLSLMWTRINETNAGSCEFILEKEPDGTFTLPLFVFNACQNDLWSLLCAESDSFVPRSDFAQDYRNASCTDSVLVSLHRQISIAQLEELDFKRRQRHLSSGQSSGSRPDDACDDFNFSWFCGQLESLYCRAFVAAVYRSLVSDRLLKPSDIKLAVEGKCEETNLEINATEFMITICEHYKEFLAESIQHRRGTMDSTTSCDSFHMNSIAEIPVAFHKYPCHGSSQEFVSQGIEKILRRYFRPVAGCEDFYYYKPPIRMNEPVSEDNSFATIPDEDHDPDEIVSFENRASGLDDERASMVQLESLGTSASLSTNLSTFVQPSETGRTIKLSFSQLTSTRDTLRSLPDWSDSASDVYSNISEEDFAAQAWRYPVFLNLGCSIRLGGDLYTCTVKRFPTCLSEILHKCEFDAWESDLCNMKICLDMVILTASKEEQLQAMEDTAIEYNVAESLEILTENAPALVSHPNSDMPFSLRLMLDWLITEISLKLNNEVYFCMYRSGALSRTILSRMIDQTRLLLESSRNLTLRTSNNMEELLHDEATPCIEQIHLSFILRDDASLVEFRDQLAVFSHSYFKLFAVEPNLYYARIDRDAYFRLVGARCVGRPKKSAFLVSSPSTIASSSDEFVSLSVDHDAKQHAHDDGTPVKTVRSSFSLNEFDTPTFVDSQPQLGTLALAEPMERGENSANARGRIRSLGAYAPGSTNNKIDNEDHVGRSSVDDSVVFSKANAVAECPRTRATIGHCYRERSGRKNRAESRFRIARSHSFAGFSALYHSERAYMLKGKWSSSSGNKSLMTFDPRTLRRLILRSGGAQTSECKESAANDVERYASSWTEAWYRSPLKDNLLSDSEPLNQESTMETGYDAESSTATYQEDFVRKNSQEKNVEAVAEVPDFWLVCRLSELCLDIYFYERIQNTHRIIYVEFVNALRKLLKTVNQKMLLNNLMETRRCDSLLVGEDGSKFESSLLHPTKQLQEDDDFYDAESGSFGYLAAASKWAPNSFACPCVYFRWFDVHPRLKTGAGRVGVNRAVHAIKSLLYTFMVHNRENLYVFKESESGAVFYIRLYDRPPSSQLDLSLMEGMMANRNCAVKFVDSQKPSFAHNKKTLSASSVQSIEQKTIIKNFNREFTNKILVTVHGICEPGDEIKNQLMNALDNKLKDAILDQLLLTIARNPNFKMTSEDTQFLQPTSSPPSKVWYFTLPFLALNHLYAVNYYLHQHLLDCLYEPNYSPKVERFRISQNMLSEEQDSDSKIYLYYPRDPGRRVIAVISLCIVDANDRRVPLIHSDPLDVAVQRSDIGSGAVAAAANGGFAQFFFSGYSHASLTRVAEYNVSGDATDSVASRNQTMTSSTQTTTSTMSSTTLTIDKTNDASPAIVSTSKATTRTRIGPFDRRKHATNSPAPSVVTLIRFSVWMTSTASARGGVATAATLADDKVAAGQSTDAALQDDLTQTLRTDVDHLRTLFVTALRAALCDLVTEYGLLTLSLTTALTVGRDDSSIDNAAVSPASQPVSPMGKEFAANRLQQMRKRHASAATIPSQISRINIFNFENIQNLVKRPQIQPPSVPPVTAPADPFRRRHRSYAAVMLSGSATTQGSIEGAAEVSKISTSITDGAKTTTVRKRSATVDLNSTKSAAAPTGVGGGSVTELAAGPASRYRPITRLRASFVDAAQSWMSFAADANGGGGVAVVSARFDVEATYSRRALLSDIYDSLKRQLTTNADMFCWARSPLASTPGRRWTSSSKAVLSTYESIDPTALPSDQLKNSGRSSSSLSHRSPSLSDCFEFDPRKSYFIICQPTQLWLDTVTFGSVPNASSMPDSIANLINSKGTVTQRLLPFCAATTATGQHRGFIPRQRLMFIAFYEHEIVLYAYNWVNEILWHVNRLIARCTCWQNARSTLLKRICLQKLGFFHQPEIREIDVKKNPYLTSQWLDNEYLAVNNLPPSHSLPPQKMDVNLRHTLLVSNDPSKIHFWSELKAHRATSPYLDDPIAHHGSQIWRFREMEKQAFEDDAQILEVYKTWFNAKILKEALLLPDASILQKLLNRSQLMHVVYTPLLFHPSWREKVGQIRHPKVNRLYTRASSPQFQRSRHNSGHVGHIASNAISPISQSKSSSSYCSNNDYWHVQLQELLAEQYSTYLQQILSLTRLEEREENRESTYDFLNDSRSLRNTCKEEAHELFFQQTNQHGILLVRTFFEEPYFAVQFYILPLNEIERRPLNLNEKALTNSYDELASLCSHLASLSHLHSYSYDFHLRIVAEYAAGDTQMVFKPGYNMQAFLSDFLCYYTCRPPYARTYVFEDQLVLPGLPVHNYQLYNYLLDHDKKYGLRVVRMRVPLFGSQDEFTSEYLLTSHDAYSLRANARTGALLALQSSDGASESQAASAFRGAASREEPFNAMTSFTCCASDASSDKLSIDRGAGVAGAATESSGSEGRMTLTSTSKDDVTTICAASLLSSDGAANGCDFRVTYHVLRLLMRDESADETLRSQQQQQSYGGRSFAAGGASSSSSLSWLGRDCLALKFYTIFVDKQSTFPIIEPTSYSEVGKYEHVRVPSWVIGERLSGDGAVQSRPVMHWIRSTSTTAAHAPSLAGRSSNNVVGVVDMNVDAESNFTQRHHVCDLDDDDCRRQLRTSTQSLIVEGDTAVEDESAADDGACTFARTRHRLSFMDRVRNFSGSTTTVVAGGGGAPSVQPQRRLSFGVRRHATVGAADDAVAAAASAATWRSAADLPAASIVAATPSRCGSTSGESTSAKSKRLSSASNGDRTLSTGSISGPVLKNDETSVQAEAVTYLTFVTDFESNLQQCLARKTAELKDRLRNVSKQAASHCRRDQLWHKLLMSVPNDASFVRRKDDASITYFEFQILLQCTHFVPLEELDSSLADFCKLDFAGTRDLMKSLQLKYGDHCRKFISADGCSEYLVIVSSNYLDILILVHADAKKDSSSIKLVYKDYASVIDESDNRKENKLYRSMTVGLFWQDFVNTLAYNVWCSLL